MSQISDASIAMGRRNRKLSSTSGARHACITSSIERAMQRTRIARGIEFET
jgi:hypothetical protein